MTDFRVKEIEQKAFELLPPHMVDGVLQYILKGIPPGDFLYAVFTNNFLEAVGRADNMNRMSLSQYGMFIYSYAPKGCHGSKGKVEQWIKDGGLSGRCYGVKPETGDNKTKESKR